MYSFSVKTWILAVAALGAAVSQPVAAPKTDALPAQIEALLKSDKDCRNYDADFMKKARVTAKLGETQTLYLLPCASGAYNIAYHVYVLDSRYPDSVRRSLFAGYSDEYGWTGRDGLVNAEFDLKTKTLSAFEKARGLGDCGSIPSYRWVEDNWRMIEYRYWGKCDGSRLPEQWPVIFRHEGPEN